MSDAKSPQDLSMDEILATIRRIIAEDERSSGAAGRGVPADGLCDKAHAFAAAERGDNVLDLTDALNEDGSVQRLEPIATAPGASGSTPAPPSAETTSAAPTALATMPDDAVSEADRAADPGVSRSATPPPGANDERLVSDVAALAAATAFGRMAGVPRARREPPPPVGGRPLDEIVRELLRPLLQTWLDEHLPGIVERLVQAEIARISARSGPD
jgi:uncharacterized protein